MMEYKIIWENIYNTDEIGFSIGSKKSIDIIVDSRVRNIGFQIELDR
jgi:hypothetical protein